MQFHLWYLQFKSPEKKIIASDSPSLGCHKSGRDTMGNQGLPGGSGRPATQGWVCKNSMLRSARAGFASQMHPWVTWNKRLHFLISM